MYNISLYILKQHLAIKKLNVCPLNRPPFQLLKTNFCSNLKSCQWKLKNKTKQKKAT